MGNDGYYTSVETAENPGVPARDPSSICIKDRCESGGAERESYDGCDSNKCNSLNRCPKIASKIMRFCP